MGKFWCLIFIAVLYINVIAPLESALAQLTIGDPSPSKVKACDEFGSTELNDPFDMSNTGDINNYFPDIDILGFSGASITGGVFSGLTTGSGSAFYLWSPVPCGAQPVGGRWGQNLSLNTAKYKQFSIAMFTDKVDPYGLRLLWDRDCNYSNSRSITDATDMPIKPGWHIYSADLSSIGIDETSSNSAAWSAGSITGFSVIPTTQTGSNIIVDWIRIEDPASCSSASSTASYAAAAQGNNDLVSLWLDNDTDPFNGFATQLAKSRSVGSNSVTLSSPLGLAPGDYRVIGLLDSDFATLETGNPWDFSSDYDVVALGSVGGATYNGSTLSGSVGSSAQIYLRVPTTGIDASKYSKLSFKLTRSATAQSIGLVYDSDQRHNIYLSKASYDANNDDVYEVDLSAQTGWSGTVTSLIFVISDPNSTFSLDFVALRKQGYVSSLDTSTLAASVVAASSYLTINSSPLLQINSPSSKGGEAIRPWNMNSGDLVTFSNLDDGADSSHSGEALTALLPDVREIDGLRGDFFKGTNDSGLNDPVNYSTFPYGVSDPISFSTDEYRYLCFKLLIDTAFSLGEGSVGRVIWLGEDGAFRTGEDIPLIVDGWTGSKWYEYCLDMESYYLDGTTAGDWSSNINALRVDPHEFTSATTYYFDYIKLRKPNRSTNGKFEIVYNLNDADDDVEASLYYNTSKVASGGTLIASGLSESQSSYLWDTSGVPNGTYYIYGVASDGSNSVTHLASGPVVVSNTGTATASPILLLEAPLESQTYCSTIQIKGYSLLTERYEDISAVEVSIDSNLVTSIKPELFNLTARAAYPGADSSNAGFDQSLNFSSYADGGHVVSVTAISSDGGQTTRTINVFKGSSGCASVVSDPAPSGVPTSVNLGGGSNVNSRPIINGLKFESSGKLSFKIKDAGSVGCTLSLRSGAKKNAVNFDSGSFTVRDAEPSSGISLQGKNVKIMKSKVPKIFLQVSKDCSGITTSSSVKQVAVKTAKGAKNITAAAKLIKKKIKRK